MKLYKLHVHTIHYCGVRFVSHDDSTVEAQKDIDTINQYALYLIYTHDNPEELDINENWQQLDQGYGIQFMGSNKEVVLQAAARLAEVMMDLPSFKQFM